MQEKIWEKEYRNSKFVTGNSKPQKFFLRFLKYLKKQKILTDLNNIKVLDLGSGMGKNANYLAQKEARVVGMEISDIAVGIAQERAKELGSGVQYLKHSIGEKYPFGDSSFDLIIDITSSNSLNEKERKIYLEEVDRVFKKNGIFFVRALCKDGDKNAKHLLKNNPGVEKDTYIMPETGLRENVFSKKDFVEMYSQYFEILDIQKTESYMRVDNRLFKRKFWLATMKKN